MINKRGQVTIFIIIAIIIVAVIALYFAFKDVLFQEPISPNIEPAYISFLTCVEQSTLTGISVLESQAGYISLPDFEPGSRYMPFSSQLDFLGNPIPYWYYISGNNIQKEQVPSKVEMGAQLADFVEEEINDCVFDQYYEQGFKIERGEPTANVIIKDNSVVVNLEMDLNIEKGEDIALIDTHKVTVSSKLGKLYNSAVKIYEEEQEDLFLEKRAVDILRLYAPVDGVELTCSPKVWNADEVFNNLEEAIEINTLALKTQGESDDYFLVDVASGIDAKFVNSRDWSNGFEVSPSEGVVLMANPIGNQPGLGILGFCYAPYHFVYNIRYPVLVQVYEEEEVFQFPVAVVIQGNNPRQALDTSAVGFEEFELCKYKNTEVDVKVYDTSMNLVEADVSYECFGEICQIGTSPLKQEFPQCVNGHILTRAEGFEDSRYLYSTIENGSVQIILDKIYEISVDLKLDGASYNQDAIIYFTSDKSSKTVVYPEQKTVELSEGEYEIQVFIYKDSSLTLGATTMQQCVDIPRAGLGGLLGLTKERCFDVEVPEQLISNVLAGGGKQSYYVLESDLRSSNIIELNAQSLPLPDSLEQLQDNYLLFEDKGLNIIFR